MKQINHKEVKALQTKYNLTEQEALTLWLEDNEIIKNEEIEKATKKAKANKVGAKASAIDKTKKREIKRTVKISTEKQMLFKKIFDFISKNYENVEILTENKLIEVKINEKYFKIDLIETRKGKNKK